MLSRHAFLPYPGDLENRASKLRNGDKGQTRLPKADDRVK